MHIIAVTSLEKVFLDQAPQPQAVAPEGFQNEIISWQLALLSDKPERAYIHAAVESPIAAYVRLRQVRHVPVRVPAFQNTDDNYLRKTPGLYPDLLSDIGPHSLRVYPNQWESIWIEVDPRSELQPGTYPVTITFTDDEGEELGSHTQKIRVLPGLLPEQTLIHTKWFYTDCLANYYHVEAFSEEHWRIIENFMREAVRGGINMILTPVHTPPLDTRRGGERLTTQLVDVTVENGEYRFGMDKLHRWIQLCKKVGVKHYEIAHLFTQWGAQHAPKIMATVDGEYKRIFGWETDAAGPEYGAFLKAYIPAIREVLRAEGVEQNSWWHISDEPQEAHLPFYLAAKKQVTELLKGCPIMDALSSYAFYEQGLVKHPVVASNHMAPFLENNVPDRWMYYCCGQHIGVSNLFIAMPGARNRILGLQLFKYDIVGFLQWGFNFYNSQYSDYPIDPYATADVDGFAQAGDAFQVYPGPGGVPEISMRHAVTIESMQDLRAIQWLASLDAEAAQEIVKDITLTEYPHDAKGVLALRKKVNEAICRLNA